MKPLAEAIVAGPLLLDGAMGSLLYERGVLHTRSYEEILAGKGYGIEAVRPSIEIVSSFRSKSADLRAGDQHPFVRRYVA